MTKRLFYFLIVLFAAISSATTHVAVLETISEKDVIGRSEKMFLTDKLRERAKAVLPAYMGYVVMTRENINAMLPPGKSIEDCEGSCLVETGKNISADYVAQARVGKFGKQLTLTMELYETAGNNLVGSFTARTSDAEGLLEEIERESDKFFAKILGDASVGLKNGNIDRNGEGSPSDSKKRDNKGIAPLKDSRDGKNYRTVKIGDQVWMAENLDYKLKESYCYENKDANCAKYGRLYTWDAAKNACPTGWHLPSKDEIEILFEVAGGELKAGRALKSRREWYHGNSDLDAFDFSALPAGFTEDGEKFVGLGGTSFGWSLTDNGKEAFSFSFYAGIDRASFFPRKKGFGFSVRCVKGTIKEKIQKNNEDGLAFSTEDGVFKDSRNGKKYRTVKNGSQVWMAENLDYKTKDSYCYENKDANCVKYGRLYTWNAAKRACPPGWHLPSNVEWNSVPVENWNVFAGYFYVSKESFYKKDEIAYYWTSTEVNSEMAYDIDVSAGTGAFVKKSHSKTDVGFSVRCTKD